MPPQWIWLDLDGRDGCRGFLFAWQRHIQGDLVLGGQREDQPDPCIGLLATDVLREAVDALSGIGLDVHQFVLAKQSEVVTDKPDALVEFFSQAGNRLRLLGQMTDQFESDVAPKQ